MDDRGFREAPRLSDLAAGLEMLQKYWRSIQPPEPVVPIEQYNFAAEALPGPEEGEAGGEVGMEGDSPGEQPVAQENDALRPCPFCGEAPELDFNAVRCLSGGCSVAMGWFRETAWNARPIEDRLREELAEGRKAWRELALAAKGLVSARQQKMDEQAADINNLQQLLAEEQQYTEELERRLAASEKAREALLALLQAKPETSYDLAFDRAQLRAITVFDTTNLIADWLAANYGAVLANRVRECEWQEGRGNDREEVYNVWKEREDWKWARRAVCELIQWSLEMPNVRRNLIRNHLQLLLENVEKAIEEVAGKRGDAHCSQEE